MGILEQVIGSVVGAKLGRGRAGGSPVMKALMMLLAAEAAKQVLARRRGGASGDRAPGGGLGDIFGGILGGGGQGRDAGFGANREGAGAGGPGGGLGGLLGGVAAGGGLGALIDHFTRNGYGSQARSWVSTQPNQQISPHQLAEALGPETVDALEQETGLPRDQILAELSETLPDTVDQLTPDGDVPDPQRMQ
jgi:uncharacterized protein YidB (DUF937 family)